MRPGAPSVITFAGASTGPRDLRDRSFAQSSSPSLRGLENPDESHSEPLNYI